MQRSLFFSTLLTLAACGAPAPAPLVEAAAAPPAPVAEPVAATAQAPSAEPQAPPPPAEPAPAPADATPQPSKTLKGILDQQIKGNEFVHLLVTDARATCGAPVPPVEGAKMLDVTMQWKTGYYDVGLNMASVLFAEYTGGRWRRTPAKKGSLELRAAPPEKGGVGRLHLHIEGPSEPTDAEIDVDVCVGVTFKRK